MKKRVVLVQPKVGSWDDNIIRRYYKIPLSLLSAVRYVVEHYQVVVIDQRVDKQWRESLERELERDPICVGTTCLTGEQIKYALEISRYVKSVSDIPMVWGGIHASIMPEQTLENPNIDIVVQGEGEVTFLELVDALANQKPIDAIVGIWCKKEDKITGNPPSDFLDLNALPPVPYELVDLSVYTPELTLETSRGCPYRCRYCYNANYNRGKWRTMSTENVIKELRRIKERYNVQGVLFIDDNFFVDIKHTRTILETIVEEKLFSTWGSAGMRIDTVERVDESFIELMKNSGCFAIETGIESLSDKVLNIINKGINKQRILELNRLFGKHKILLSCNFMIGFPGEEIEDLKETSRAIVQMAEENPYMRITFVSIFQPYPGTALYSECVKLGLKEPERLEDWITWAWDNIASWRSDEVNRLLDSINSAGYGLRHNKHNPSRGLLFDSAWSLFRSVEMFRLKHFFFKAMIENRLKRIVSNTRKLF